VVRARIGLATGALAVGLLVACSATPSSTASSAPPAAATASTAASPAAGAMSGSSTPQTAVTIHISSYRFEVPASVAPGQKVEVMNMDQENHTVTADSGNAFNVTAIAGQTVTFTAPMKAGSYAFHCAYHSDMHAVLVVK
jgi:plastocyanin